MQNIGEELVGAYLQVVKNCNFIHYNFYTPDVQGEIDVVGINMPERIVYICEVAIHLITGLQYVRANQPDNVRRLVGKFEKDVDYAAKFFPDYTRVFMLWSPIVKSPREGAKHSQVRDVAEIAQRLKLSRHVDLQVIINEDFQRCVEELKSYAAAESKELKSPVLRLLQIEQKLKAHIAKRQN